MLVINYEIFFGAQRGKEENEEDKKNTELTNLNAKKRFSKLNYEFYLLFNSGQQ